ncbi:hypothetical protein ANN_09021 [Periplaneta americana]|uniref:HTH psq-type domain-containing protein n=1 Tax=Periplaneta americana TaxID=6978 RepID=A0ABQ8TMF3_PERAM|nr:hypothetical protein ANN_09021 [Periplaneta americana]
MTHFEMNTQYILNTQLQFNTHTLFDVIVRHSIQTANPHHRNNTPHPYHRQLHIAESRSPVVQETLKTTTHSVETGRLSKMPSNINITSGAWTEDQMQKAIKAFREGRSQRHAADLYGVPHSCLQRVCKADNREGLELNWLHQLLVYADDVNMLGENPQMVRENTGILLEASKEIGLDVNPEKTREEHRLRVFENKVLRKIFGKRDEVTGEWRKLHNTELHALYSSPDIIRNIKSRHLRWAGHVARMGESRNAYRVLVGRPEGKRPLGRPRRRWENNIKMDLREVGFDDRDWINLAQDKDQWRAYRLREYLNALKNNGYTADGKITVAAESTTPTQPPVDPAGCCTHWTLPQLRTHSSSLHVELKTSGYVALTGRCHSYGPTQVHCTSNSRLPDTLHSLDAATVTDPLKFTARRTQDLRICCTHWTLPQLKFTERRTQDLRIRCTHWTLPQLRTHSSPLHVELRSSGYVSAA